MRNQLALLLVLGLIAVLQPAYVQAADDDEGIVDDASGSGSGDDEDVIGETVPGDYEPELEAGMSFVEDDDAMDEFFVGIKDDTMMQQVISDMNGLENAIERERLTRGGNVSELAEQTLAAMKRFADLKKLVSWLQPKDKRISRYCFYGCWCLPEGAHGFVAGTGRPVDLVDKSCQYLWFCYTCAKEDFGHCNPNIRRYSYKFYWDTANRKDHSKRGIICTNGWRKHYNDRTVKYNCARAICECDRGLAMRLYKYWTHWAKSRHRIWSKSTDEGLFIVEERCQYEGSPGSGPEHQLICCGRYHSMGSRFPTRDHGGTRACCSEAQGSGNGLRWYGNMYNTLTQCCVDGAVTTPGGGGALTC
jgi:hypothetical protein